MAYYNVIQYRSYTTVFNRQCASETSGDLVKTWAAGPHPRLSDSIGKGLGPRICISNKLQRDLNVTDNVNYWATKLIDFT